jgi:hypothetical protein
VGSSVVCLLKDVKVQLKVRRTLSSVGTSSSNILPHIECVIDHHEHVFVMHNIAHLLCKGHLDDILALLLFHHIKLATLKEDNTGLISG